MGVGLEVRNENDEPIIDTSIPNYGFIRKVSMDSLPRGKPSANPNVSWWQDWKYLDVPNGFAPMIFARGDAGVSIITVEVVGNNYRYFFAYYETSSNTQLYIFDLMFQHLPSGATHEQGLESFDENGRLIFTTAMKPMKLVHISKPSKSRYNSAAGAMSAYGGYFNNPTSDGINGMAMGGGWDDWWSVSDVPQDIEVAATMTRFRYGASSSSTESNYGDALFEALTSKVESGKNIVKVEPTTIGLFGEGWGGFMGTELDSILDPYILMIDVTGY